MGKTTNGATEHVPSGSFGATYCNWNSRDAYELHGPLLVKGIRWSLTFMKIAVSSKPWWASAIAEGEADDKSDEVLDTAHVTILFFSSSSPSNGLLLRVINEEASGDTSDLLESSW